ncbi:MAG: S8 family serine peptidase [Micromonosporaceae bacterium]|nr:S8 family serine peptidase [Micromonosporaceae bacterium]
MTERGDHARSEELPEQSERPAPAPPPGPPPTLVGTLPPPTPWPSAPATPSWQGPLAAAYVGAAGLVIAAVGFLAHAGTWFFEQIAITQGTSEPWWPAAGWASAVVAALLTLPILFFPRRMVALRTAGWAWMAGALLLGVLGTVRAVPHTHHELYLAALALVAGGIALAAQLVRRRNRPAPQVRQPDGSVTAELVPEPVAEPAPWDAVWLGFAGGLATLIPWLWIASLGGLMETVLAALAAATVGAAAGTVLGASFWRPLTGLPRWQLVLGGGYVSGVTLLLLASGVGVSGVTLAAMLAVPALGYAAAALQRSFAAPSGVPVGVLIGVAVFGPLGFVDPEEMSILLGFTDVLGWAMLAAVIALGVALVAGLAYGLLLRRALLHGWLAALVAAVVLGAGLGAHAAAGHPGLHGDRIFVVLSSQASLSLVVPSTGPENRAVRVGAVYRRLVSHAERTQRPLREDLDRLGLHYTPYYLVNGISVRAGAAVREWLSRREDVDRVLLDPVLRPIPRMPSAEAPAETLPPREPPWNLAMIGAPRVWSDFDATGKRIVVGSSDSGVDGSHPALRDGFRGGPDSWHDPWNHTRKPTDFNGHGTHTTGTAVGDENIGVAPDATWIGCVNLARNMAGPSAYLDCMQFMLAPFKRGGDPFRDGDPTRAPHVLNNSWGCPELEGCDAPALAPAVLAMRAAGIFFVASAGNTGPRCGSLTDPPARYHNSFAVGAVNETGEVAGFSSRALSDDAGPRPDVAAPGEDVLSAVPGGYASQSGTSMAGPHVAGAVALLWSAVPSLIGDIPRTEKLLQRTARPISGQEPCGEGAAAGAGIVDAHAAVKRARR